VLSTHHLRVWLNMAYSTGVKNLLLSGSGVSAHVGVAAPPHHAATPTCAYTQDPDNNKFFTPVE